MECHLVDRLGAVLPFIIPLLPSLDVLHLSAVCRPTRTRICSLVNWLNAEVPCNVEAANLALATKCTGLQQFTVTANALQRTTSLLVEQLSSLLALQNLHVQRCTLQTLAPLRNLIHLKHLSLNSCSVAEQSGPAPTPTFYADALAPLSMLTSLLHLSLQSFFPVTDQGLSHLTCLTALQLLDISTSSITDTGLRCLTSLSHLRHLSLRQCIGLSIGCWEILARLTSLQHLDLHEAGRTHLPDIRQIPTVGLLSNLQQLQHLDVEGCPLVSWTHHISLLTSLRHLVAGHTCPSELALLSMLQCVSSLEVRIRPVWGEVFHPNCFDALPPLHSVDLRVTDVGFRVGWTDLFTAVLARSHSASLVRLEVVDLTDSGMAQLSSFKALRDLSAHGCMITTVMAVQALCTLTGLRALHLHLNQGAVLTHDVFAPVIEALSGVTCLSLSNLPMTDEAAGLISRLPRLQSLQLESWSRDVGHADDHLSEFARLRELRSASFSQETLGGEGLAHLSAMDGLRRLCLRDCSLLNTSGLAQVTAVRGLQQLSITTSYDFLEAIITSLHFLSGLESLQAMELCYDDPSDIDVPKELSAALPHLLKLTLGNASASDNVMEHITLLTNLRCLKLSDSNRLRRATDRSLECIARLPHLRKLCLQGLVDVTDAGLGHLSALHGLQRLKLGSCQAVTWVGQELLHSRLPALCITST